MTLSGHLIPAQDMVQCVPSILAATAVHSEHLTVQHPGTELWPPASGAQPHPRWGRQKGHWHVVSVY